MALVGQDADFCLPAYQTRRASEDDPRRKLEPPPNDLRPNSAPLRSEAIVEALEMAIQRYQGLPPAAAGRPYPARA